jgi:hypothetical protein
MKSSALVPPDVDLLKQASHANLRERLELDSNPRPRPIRLIPWNEMGNAFLYDVIDEPVISALRLQLAELGQYLYRATGSTAAMARIASEVIQQLPKNSHGFCIDLVDKNWNGIGQGSDAWVA